MVRKIKKNTKLSHILIAFVLLLLIFSAFNLQLTLNTLKQRKQALEAELKQAEYELSKLNAELDREMDDDYIASVAREKLNFSDPDEVIFYNDLSD